MDSSVRTRLFALLAAVLFVTVLAPVLALKLVSPQKLWRGL